MSDPVIEEAGLLVLPVEQGPGDFVEFRKNPDGSLIIDNGADPNVQIGHDQMRALRAWLYRLPAGRAALQEAGRS